VAPNGGRWIWPLAPWVGMGDAVQTDAVVVRSCHAIVEHLGLLVRSNYFLMTHGAARVCGRRTDEMAVDARTRGGVGGYDRGNPKYNGANQGWKRLQYIYTDY
jgi:hypothetical protein